MTDIPLDLSTLNRNHTMARKTKPVASNNLFNNQQRNHTMSSVAPLPIITLSTFCNFEEKLIQMATNNKANILAHAPIELPMEQVKPRVPVSNRSNVSTLSRSSLTFPSTLTRCTKQSVNDRSLHVFHSPMSSHRTLSARTPHNNFNRSPRPPPQQEQAQSVHSRPNSQYGHFLAYLRRQSLARMRRKQQEEEEGNSETTGAFNFNKNSSPQHLHSTSNSSLTSLVTDIPSSPSVSVAARHAGRPLSTYRQVQRSTTNYRLNQLQKSPPATLKISNDDQLTRLTSSLLITPANSVVDDATMSPIKPPYEVHVNDDKLNYCYISDDSGVKYQGQMLSTSI